MVYYCIETAFHAAGESTMTHQMTIELTEQEYATLAAEAAKSGKQPETLLHEMLH